MGFCNCSMFCHALLYVLSSFAIILMAKRELVALLSLSFWCLVIAVWLFLTVPWVCLQFVIVVFHHLTHYFLFMSFYGIIQYSKNLSKTSLILPLTLHAYLSMWSEISLLTHQASTGVVPLK